jgi:hypothetical protein
LQAVTEPEPVPTPDVLTSGQAAADYDAAVEGWGDRLWRAGGRLCRWAKRNGMAIDCPPPPVDEAPLQPR